MFTPLFGSSAPQQSLSQIFNFEAYGFNDGSHYLADLKSSLITFEIFFKPKYYKGLLKIIILHSESDVQDESSSQGSTKESEKLNQD